MTDIEILYEDACLMVVNKPAGLLSEYHTTEPSVPFLLSSHGGQDFPLTPITRLDRGVGGVMLLAKTKKTAAFLSERVADHTLFEKEYLAVVGGKMEEAEGELHDLLFKDSSKNKTFVVKRMRKGVKEASLSYRVLCEAQMDGKDVSLVRVRLHTGRTHQIRVQFASRRHPLLGDGKYGGASDTGLCLHACRLSFPHPSGKRLTFSSYPASALPWSLFGTLPSEE